MCPSELSAGFSGSQARSCPTPALAGTKRCCAMAAALTAPHRAKLKSVFMFTKERHPQRKRSRGKGYGASCVSRTPHMALKSHSDFLGDAWGGQRGCACLWGPWAVGAGLASPELGTTS